MSDGHAEGEQTLGAFLDEYPDDPDILYEQYLPELAYVIQCFRANRDEYGDVVLHRSHWGGLMDALRQWTSEGNLQEKRNKRSYWILLMQKAEALLNLSSKGERRRLILPPEDGSDKMSVSDYPFTLSQELSEKDIEDFSEVFGTLSEQKEGQSADLYENLRQDDQTEKTADRSDPSDMEMPQVDVNIDVSIDVSIDRDEIEDLVRQTVEKGMVNLPVSVDPSDLKTSARWEGGDLTFDLSSSPSEDEDGGSDDEQVSQLFSALWDHQYPDEGQMEEVARTFDNLNMSAKPGPSSSDGEQETSETSDDEASSETSLDIVIADLSCQECGHAFERAFLQHEDKSTPCEECNGPTKVTDTYEGESFLAHKISQQLSEGLEKVKTNLFRASSVDRDVRDVINDYYDEIPSFQLNDDLEGLLDVYRRTAPIEDDADSLETMNSLLRGDSPLYTSFLTLDGEIEGPADEDEFREEIERLSEDLDLDEPSDNEGNGLSDKIWEQADLSGFKQAFGKLEADPVDDPSFRGNRPSFEEIKEAVESHLGGTSFPLPDEEGDPLTDEMVEDLSAALQEEVQLDLTDEYEDRNSPEERDPREDPNFAGNIDEEGSVVFEDDIPTRSTESDEEGMSEREAIDKVSARSDRSILSGVYAPSESDSSSTLPGDGLEEGDQWDLEDLSGRGIPFVLRTETGLSDEDLEAFLRTLKKTVRQSQAGNFTDNGWLDVNRTILQITSNEENRRLLQSFARSAREKTFSRLNNQTFRLYDTITSSIEYCDQGVSLDEVLDQLEITEDDLKQLVRVERQLGEHVLQDWLESKEMERMWDSDQFQNEVLREVESKTSLGGDDRPRTPDDIDWNLLEETNGRSMIDEAREVSEAVVDPNLTDRYDSIETFEDQIGITCAFFDDLETLEAAVQSVQDEEESPFAPTQSSDVVGDDVSPS